MKLSLRGSAEVDAIISYLQCAILASTLCVIILFASLF